MRDSEPDTDDHALAMLLEPMYVLTGRNFEEYEKSYDVDVTPADEATSAIFASEPLTEDTDDWSEVEFGQTVVLERIGENISKTIGELDV